MPRVEIRGEAIDWVAYDSVTPGASDKEVTMFQERVGESSKTIEDTNMRDGGKMPSDQVFDIHAIRFLTNPDITSTNLIGLLKDASAQIYIGEKPYYQCPLMMLTAGCGIDGLTTATSIEAYHNGAADPRAIHTLKRPLSIEANETFRVEVSWKTAPGAVKFWIALEGELKRAVQ